MPVLLVAASVSDGQPHTQDMTADWQKDHQHLSRQPQRTLSGCQEGFMQNTGIIKVLNLFILMWTHAHELTDEKLKRRYFSFISSCWSACAINHLPCVFKQDTEFLPAIDLCPAKTLIYSLYHTAVWLRDGNMNDFSI